MLGRKLLGARFRSPFFLRTAVPSVESADGRKVRGLRRIGKRIVFELEGELFLVLHLMVTGRLLWRKKGAKPPGKFGLAAFDFPTGALLVVEYGSRKKASLHVVSGEDALKAHDPGGVEPLVCDAAEFAEALRRENHTLKRALTDPRILAGIGNAWSDEILHHARMSPFALTGKLADEEIGRLFKSVRCLLEEWTERLRAEIGDGFPEKVKASKPGMAVHGRYREPCPDCGSPVQRIRYAQNETNYCATCQTGGKLLADRGLSRLLKGDWPRTLEELEGLRGK